MDRAGIASPIPNENGTCNILDAGANPEAKAKNLATYAVMGSVYARQVLGVENPVVGIMSNGEEEEKGTNLTKEAFILLRHMVDSGKANFEFRGNVEGHDLFETKLDVCLCDGFTGNVVLKSCEATAKAMSKWLKKEFKRTPFRVLGSASFQRSFRQRQGANKLRDLRWLTSARGARHSHHFPRRLFFSRDPQRAAHGLQGSGERGQPSD